MQLPFRMHWKRVNNSPKMDSFLSYQQAKLLIVKSVIKVNRLFSTFLMGFSKDLIASILQKTIFGVEPTGLFYWNKIVNFAKQLMAWQHCPTPHYLKNMIGTELKNQWSLCLDFIRDNVSKAVFDTWFSVAEPVSLEETANRSRYMGIVTIGLIAGTVVLLTAFRRKK